ncbi:hypothetical protein [Qipengyuania mesophila]|uniref:hypothetical protein n=1 Tax=Qipengyuania mesophila TaxID=2867246 RepID=UPI0035145C1E
MKTIPLLLAPVSALALLAACSSPSDEAAAPEDSDIAADAATDATPTSSATPAQASARTLTLDGLGGLTIGKPVPAGSSFTAGEGQIGNGCETLSSPDWPGVYALRTGGVVKRISVSDGSGVTLEEGVGPGSTIEDVRAAFPGFRETPHKYTEGKYLTQPGTDPRLRFETDPDGTVTIVHVGMMPELGYVEGCA